MPPTLEWPDVALRLALTLLAGFLVGLNRSERGRAAGLRTTILVCLAASVAMIQANLLLATNGKPEDSYVHMDVMRLPLGILCGIGFIGAGAILRRGEMIRGVTTAATLWVMTVVGLCFGGGQIGLGLAALVSVLIVLHGLKVELWMRQDRLATLIVCSSAEGPAAEELRASVLAAGFQITSWRVTYHANGPSPCRTTIHCEVQWHGLATDTQPPPLVHQYRQHPGVLKLQWKA